MPAPKLLGTSVAISQGLSLAQNPDALYAVALNSLGANPVAMAFLSPISRAIFDQIYTQVSGLAGEEISTMGASILAGASGALTSLIGASGAAAASATMSAIGNAVGQVIGDVAPFVGMIVSNVVELSQLSANFYAPSVAANQAITTALLSRPVQGTAGGAGGFAVTPADIFAPSSNPSSAEVSTDAQGKRWYIDQWTQLQYPGVPFPYSSLGLCLAGMTEHNDYHAPPYYEADVISLTGVTANGGWSGGDSTIRHHSVAAKLMPFQYNSYLAEYGTPAEPSVGVPWEVARTMQLLRLAMGSRASTQHGDPSAMLYAMWSDLFVGLWAAGHLTGGYAGYSLAHLWGPDHWNDARIDGPGRSVPQVTEFSDPFGFVNAHDAFQGASVDDWSPIIVQAVTMMQSWQEVQKKAAGMKPTKMVLHFAPKMTTGKKVAIAGGVVGTLAAGSAAAYYLVPGVKAALGKLLRRSNPSRKRRGKRGSDLDR